MSASCRLVVHVSEQNVRNMSFEGSTSFSDTCAQSPEQWSWIGICPRVPGLAGPPVLPNSLHKLEQNNWLPMDFVLFSKQCILFQMTPNCAILPNILPSLPSHTHMNPQHFHHYHTVDKSIFTALTLLKSSQRQAQIVYLKKAHFMTQTCNETPYVLLIAGI